MKTILLFIMLVAIPISGLMSQTTHDVNESGFAYNPDTITINAGDGIKFNGSASHPIQQVSEATYIANGITPLEGGFSYESGSGTVSFPVAGSYYYVCTAHVASFGMKGLIIVQVPTGLADLSSSGKYSVYPVPLNGNELTIAPAANGQKQLSVTIYDIAGNMRIATSGITRDGLFHVDCSSLPRGLFMIKLDTGDEVTYAKIIRN